MRDEEWTEVNQFANSDGAQFTISYNIKKQLVLESALNIARTIFVSIVLAIAALFFSNDANRLVLTPIERMLEKVKLIAKNPLAAASEEVDTAGIYSMMHQQENNKNGAEA